ncbi:MAG: TfuA-related McrA-glycine thioamidation protein [Halobacteriota archaeon]
MAKCDCVIFTGPSLSWSEATSVDQRIRCCPPAIRGDISKASKMGITIIGLIDGVFFNRAAVSHREIIEAIKMGVTVVGGSSMGALRASELDNFGMIGVGKIYECFKEGVIEADDEVAVGYNPVTYEPVSDPLVNMRDALHALVDASIVNRHTRNALFKIAKSLFYLERSFPSVLKTAELRGQIDSSDRKNIETFLTCYDYDIKKRDAKLVLKEVVSRCGRQHLVRP